MPPGATIEGWVDLKAGLLGPASQPGRRSDETSAGVRSVAGPGLEVAVAGADADLAFDRRFLVACAGRARFADRAGTHAAQTSGSAMAWLELLARERRAGLARVSGQYAVVFVDLEERSAIVACDRFAIEPICLAVESGRLAFADRADAVPIAGSREIDPQAIYDYLYFHVIPTPRTVFHGITRLPPAHVAEVTSTGVRVEPHWTPVFAERRSAGMDELKEEFRELVREAVGREAAGNRVGCFLSGGTDSSTVAGMLGLVSGRPASAYSIGFEAQGYDEMAYARIAARHFGADHHEYYLTPDDLVRSIPEVARHYDQPFGNASALPAYYCARMAKDDGLERLLAGDGGDELFGGNTRYATQQVFQAYHRIPTAVRSAVIEPILLSAGGLEAVPLLRKGVRYVRQARLPMPDRMNNYNLLEWLGVGDVLEEAFLQQVDVEDPAKQQRATYSQVNGSIVNAMLAYDWKYTLADNDLPKVCRTAALAGVEVGFPLLGEAIVDFSLRLPSSLKLRGLKLRYFFKEALRGFLPDEIIAKKKQGFGLPFGPWVISHEPLGELARASLASLAQRGIIRRSFLDDLMNRRLAEHPAYFGGMVWVLMMLEQWLASREPGVAVTRAGS
jgi:asparagine synthase (glutamine-hydrolysing)